MQVDKIGRGHQGDPSSALLELLDGGVHGQKASAMNLCVYIDASLSAYGHMYAKIHTHASVFAELYYLYR